MKHALPPAPALLTFGGRTLLLWGAGRGLLLLLGVGVGSVSTSLWIVVLVGLLMFADARRRGELVYLADLGVPPAAPALVCAGIAACLEGGAALLLGAP